MATQPKTDLSCGDGRPSWAAGTPKALELVSLTGIEKRLHQNRRSPCSQFVRNFSTISDPV